MIGMTNARKVKVSVSIDPSVLGAVDRYAARTGVTRSAAMERWLAQVSHRENLTRLEEETATYYEAMSEAERRDDAGWAVGASAAARRLDIDGPRAPRRRSK
jgi:predicted chitinase